jgi:hypothetical protein
LIVLLVYRQILAPVFASLCATYCLAVPPQEKEGSISSAPTPQVFAPGLVSGPANDGSPTFSPDGNTIFFTRSSANWSVIVESHKIHGQWSRPTLASFSGEWSDSSPEMSPDGTYLVFESKPPKQGESAADIVSSLWRVDRIGTGWSKPKRLPDTVNLDGQSLWKPSVAIDGTIYFASIDANRVKRLFSSKYLNDVYQQAQPPSFSDGTTLDVDPEIAPDGSFLVFCSAGRMADDKKDHLFIVRRTAEGWGPVVPIRYSGRYEWLQF